jgi:hypothetical protein
VITTEQIAAVAYGEPVVAEWKRSFNRRPEIQRYVGDHLLCVYVPRKNGPVTWAVDRRWRREECTAESWEEGMRAAEESARAFLEDALRELSAAAKAIRE